MATCEKVMDDREPVTDAVDVALRDGTSIDIRAVQGAEVSVFGAVVMPGNHRMIEVFRDSGFLVEARSEEGTMKIELSLLARSARREPGQPW